MLNLALKLCLFVPSRRVTAPFPAALRFSVLLTFSLAMSLHFVFSSFCVFYPLLSAYAFLFFCAFCTTLCSPPSISEDSF